MSIQKLLNKITEDPFTGCWLWTGAKFPSGYGILNYKYKGKIINRAHRVSYILHYGDIPKGKFVCHACDIKHCVNPQHLWIGTAKENRDDCVRKGRTNIAKGSQKSKIFNEGQISFIRAILQLNVFTHQQIADAFKVKRRTISAIADRSNWKHV